MPASSERRVARGLAPRAPKPIAAAATKVEVAPSKAVKVDKEPKADAHALLGDVAKFAASLGLGGAAASGGGDFSDFAPGLAARRLSGAKASTREAKDATEPKESKPAKGERKGGKKDAADGGAARMGKGADADGAPEGTGGKPAGARPVDKRVKERGWNTGIEPRPGGNHPLLAGAGGDKSLLGRDESIWWKALDALPPLVGDPAAPSGGDADLDRCEILRQEGEKLVEAESAVFERDLAKRAAADYKWLQQVKRGGTTADKVAAMTLQIRESVIANLKALDTLLSWVTKRKGGKEVVRQAIEALQELFLTCLLPSRRMKFLEQQPVHLLQAESKDGRKRLLLWYIEDSVKRRYSIFVGALEECSRADLEFLKERATKACYECLVAKPEAEAKLLSTLVNKLGDPSRKVASKAGYLMSQLLLQHPAMKPIVVREVERFLFRPGLQERARYYGIVFLNQLVLSHKESEGGGGLALKLVELYFTMFRLVIQGHYGRAGEARKAQDEKYKTELRKFRKQQAKAQDKASSSGTRAPPDKKPPRAPHRASAEEMDARMLGALITGVRRAFPYVPENKVEPLVESSGEQLFKIVHAAPFTVGVQALMLMYQITSNRNAIPDRFYRALYSVLLTDGPSTSTKAPMFLGLLFKAMKTDVCDKRVSAMSKRLLQSAHNAAPNFACAVLFMLSEVLKAHPALWSGILQQEDTGSGLEAFADVDVDSDDGGDGDKAAGKDEEEAEAEAGGDDDDDTGDMQLDAARPASGGAPSKAPASSAKATDAWPAEDEYDMAKREPLFANADRACWWELTSLASHAHPSVSAMARTLMSGQPVLYDGDPLKDHTLVSFLDKFLAKKPRSHARGSSLMQPLGGVGAATGQRSLADLSSSAFAALAESKVEPADLFFHKFVNLGNVKSKREKRDEERAAKEAAGGDDSDDPDDGEPDSEEIDRILEPAEKALDDDLGDPDIGYSYADLGRAMEDDEDLMADDEEGVAMGDGGEEGEAEEEEAEEGEDGEDGLEYALDAMSDSGSEGGGEDDDDGDNVSDDDSDSDGEFELAPGAAEYLAAAEAAAAGTSKKKKGAKAKALPTVSRAVDGDAEPGSEDIEREGLTFMDLPSASDSEGEEEEGEEEDEDGDSMEGNEFEGMSSDEDEDGAGGEEGDDDEEMDDDAFAALMRGRAGSDSDEGGDGGEGDEEEGVEAAPGHKRGASAVAVGSAKADGKPGKPAKRADGKRADGKPVKRAKKSPDDVFAPADEYDEFFNTHTKSLEQRHEGKEVGSVRPGGRGGGAKRGGGGGRSGRGGREGGGRGRVGRRS